MLVMIMTLSQSLPLIRQIEEESFAISTKQKACLLKVCNFKEVFLLWQVKHFKLL
jgi:hypothetical protein